MCRMAFDALLAELKANPRFSAVATLAAKALMEHPNAKISGSETFQSRDDVLKIQSYRLQRAERLQTFYVYGMRETVDSLTNSDSTRLKMLLASDDRFAVSIWITPEGLPIGLILAP